MHEQGRGDVGGASPETEAAPFAARPNRAAGRRGRARSDPSDDHGPRHPLAGTSSREILTRLVDGDPLAVGAACEGRLLERCLLLDARRLTLQAMARMAYRAPAWGGAPALGAWMRARIDEAVDDLLRKDREEERRGLPPAEPWDERYAFVAEVLGVRLSLARHVCITLNGLPDDARHAFFHVVARGESLHRYVARWGGPPERVEALLRRAFREVSRRAPRELGSAERAAEESGPAYEVPPGGDERRGKLSDEP